MKNSLKALALAAVVGVGMASAAEAQNRSRSYQAYAVIDLQTDAPKARLIDAAERALSGYASDLNTSRPIAVQTPERPGRFKLENPLGENSRLGALAALGGVSAQSFMIATCDGAVWVANLTRSISGSQQMRATLCLFPYANDQRQGYHLNLFVNDTAESGGGLSQRFGRAVAGRLVGTPQEFTERMLKDTVFAMEGASGASAVLIEGEPEIPGLAWKR
ncbi:hypothetical protein [Brevundimonas nasdae]|uniref:Uncharacterized protein n=2 Tax=Brevundimonas nasdae TaxID=172043 RepID=A0ABX8TMC1_9CAUL|nr:hypothetical protein [Brevundimonas nasdae]QYC12386.1 hypothetical protein KWG56_18255 [Brevundimonas nasdae]